MTPFLLAPVYLWFLALIPVVVLLYLLKLKRTPVVISSTMLWMRSLQDLTANAPFQRLRKNLLLFLQILILLALIVGLARPYVVAEGVTGDNICLIIDRSASMMAREAGGTRIEIAKAKALEMIDGMARDERMMVVAFDTSTEVLCELTNDRFRLREAVRRIQPAPTSTVARDAMLVALSLIGSPPEHGEIESAIQIAPDLRVVLISDGRIADLDAIGTRNMNLDFLQIGETTDNAGITAFSVRQPPEGSNVPRQAFVLVHNAASTPLATTLTLSYQGEAVAVEEIVVPAEGSQEILFAIGALDEGILHVSLDHDDVLDVDNEAWLALRPAPTIDVLLAAESDSTSAYFLKRVLLLEPRVRLDNVAPSDYFDGNGYDLVIFDGFAPETIPNTSQVYFGVAPPLEGVTLGEEFARPVILSRDAEHPAMRFLNPSTVSILKTRQLDVPPDARTLWSSTAGPLMADVSRDGKSILAAGFDIADTNWPWHLSFPLFIQNLLAWVPRSQMAEETSVRAGRPLTIMPAPDVVEAVVTLPSGQTEVVPLEATRPSFFGNTTELGVYQVARGTDLEYHAVNLLDANETQLAPAESIAVGRSEIQAQRGSVRQTRELWRWFVAVGLTILMLEWWIYVRRAWM